MCIDFNTHFLRKIKLLEESLKNIFLITFINKKNSSIKMATQNFVNNTRLLYSKYNRVDNGIN